MTEPGRLRVVRAHRDDVGESGDVEQMPQRGRGAMEADAAIRATGGQLQAREGLERAARRRQGAHDDVDHGRVGCGDDRAQTFAERADGGVVGDGSGEDQQARAGEGARRR